MMWAWFLMCTAVLWLVLYRFKKRRMIQLASKLPKLSGEIPFLGIAHTLGGNSEAIMEQMKNFSYEAMKHDGLVRGWCGPFLFLGMTNPVDLEFILKTCMDKSHFHKFSRVVIGNGGLFAPVSIWRRRRKVLVPTFSPKILETFVEVFSTKSQKLVEVLEKNVGRGPVSMWSYLSSYTFDSVCETTMGVKIHALENPKTPFLVGMNRVLELVCQRFFHMWLYPDWIYRMLPQYRQQMYHLNKMHNFTDEVIQKKRKEIDAAKKVDCDQQYDPNSSSNYKAKTFLDHLIHLSGGKGDGFSNMELREELLTMALAGTDTSAVAVGFTLMLLAKYPHIQEKVYQELHEVFGDTDRPVVKEDLMKLKYLERVAKESLRLFPPVPFILRQVDYDTTLPSGRVLPAGGIIVIVIWGVHRDPKYWGPDAEVFDPDRFLPERFTQPHACSFMPFSQGPRNCVGYQYAMMSIKTVLATVLRRYKIVGEPETSPIPKIRVKLEMMMKAIDEYTVALERRKPLIDEN